MKNNVAFYTGTKASIASPEKDTGRLLPVVLSLEEGISEILQVVPLSESSIRVGAKSRERLMCSPVMS